MNKHFHSSPSSSRFPILKKGILCQYDRSCRQEFFPSTFCSDLTHLWEIIGWNENKASNRALKDNLNFFKLWLTWVETLMNHPSIHANISLMFSFRRIEFTTPMSLMPVIASITTDRCLLQVLAELLCSPRQCSIIDRYQSFHSSILKLSPLQPTWTPVHRDSLMTLGQYWMAREQALRLNSQRLMKNGTWPCFVEGQLDMARSRLRTIMTLLLSRQLHPNRQNLKEILKKPPKQRLKELDIWIQVLVDTHVSLTACEQKQDKVKTTTIKTRLRETSQAVQTELEFKHLLTQQPPSDRSTTEQPLSTTNSPIQCRIIGEEFQTRRLSTSTKADLNIKTPLFEPECLFAALHYHSPRFQTCLQRLPRRDHLVSWDAKQRYQDLGREATLASWFPNVVKESFRSWVACYHGREQPLRTMGDLLFTSTKATHDQGTTSMFQTVTESKVSQTCARQIASLLPSERNHPISATNKHNIKTTHQRCLELSPLQKQFHVAWNKWVRLELASALCSRADELLQLPLPPFTRAAQTYLLVIELLLPLTPNIEKTLFEFDPDITSTSIEQSGLPLHARRYFPCVMSQLFKKRVWTTTAEIIDVAVLLLHAIKGLSIHSEARRGSSYLSTKALLSPVILSPEVVRTHIQTHQRQLFQRKK